jgi:hypothetical protein
MFRPKWGFIKLVPEADVDDLGAHVLDEVAVGHVSRRGHVGERRQEEEPLRRRDALQRVGKVGLDVGGQKLATDFTNIWEPMLSFF